MRIKKSNFKTVYIKLTNSCQLHCDHCYNTVCPPQQTMTPKILRAVAARLENMIKTGNTVAATLHGGEPFLVDKILLEEVYKVMLTLLEKYPEEIGFSATTNLVYKIDKLLEKIFNLFDKNENGQPIISTSWDYDIRFKTDEQTLLWYNNVTSLTKKGYDVRPIITVTKPLIEEVQPRQLIKGMMELGVTSLNFERITKTGRASENEKTLIPDNKDMQRWLYEAFQHSEELGVRVPLFDLLKKSVNYGILEGCRARQCTRDVITFNPDGSVATCPNIADKIVGRVSFVTTSDIKPTDILHAELCGEERKREEGCLTCPYFEECNGDCFQLRWDETGCPGLPQIIVYLKGVKK